MGTYRLLKVETNREIVFCENARKFGADVYAPLMKIEIVRRRKKSTLVRAVLPGYVFCKGEVSRSAFERNPVKAKWLKFGGKLAEVKEKDVEDFLCRQAEGAFDRIKEYPCLTFQKGRKVRVVNGPLMNLHGVIKRAPKRAQEIATVEIYGRNVKIPLALLAILP